MAGIGKVVRLKLVSTQIPYDTAARQTAVRSEVKLRLSHEYCVMLKSFN